MVVTAVLATAGALVAAHLLIEPGLRRYATERTRDELLSEARLMARAVAPTLARATGPAEVDPIVDAAAREVRARVTIIALDGRVLGDSSLSLSDVVTVENHGSRPEVLEALATGTGFSLRHSVTVGRQMSYAAVPIVSDGRTVGVARVALSAEEIDEQVSRLKRAELLGLTLGIFVAIVLSALLSTPFARGLGALMGAARRLAAGDFSARIPVEREDELAELARILNRSAEDLQVRLAEIARDRARTGAILAALEEGILAVDHEGTVLLANEAVKRGLALEAPEDRHYLEALRQSEVSEVVEHVLRTGERRAIDAEIRHVKRHFAIVGLPFPGAEGSPHGAILTFHDATERRRVEQIRRDFVANASHELRTPLTSIRGFVEALEDGAMDEPGTAKRFLGKIRTHADRMTALIEDLLELSRLESGERAPEWETVSPAEIADDVVASFSALASRRRIALRTVEEGGPHVVTDAERLRRILMNLVENAVKYTQEGGHVDVRMAPAAEGGVRIEVCDDGPGIAAEHLPRLFERFYRADKARSRELGGTGLGLSIVRHLTDAIGGQVSVESTPGHGSTFVVLLPSGQERTVSN